MQGPGQTPILVMSTYCIVRGAVGPVVDWCADGRTTPFVVLRVCATSSHTRAVRLCALVSFVHALMLGLCLNCATTWPVATLQTSKPSVRLDARLSSETLPPPRYAWYTKAPRPNSVDAALLLAGGVRNHPHHAWPTVDAEDAAGPYGRHCYHE